MKVPVLTQRLRQWQRKSREHQTHIRQLPRVLDVRLVLPAVSVWVFTVLWILSGLKASLFFLGIVIALWGGVWLARKLAPALLDQEKMQGLLGAFALSALLLCAQTAGITSRELDVRWEFLAAAQGQGVRLTGQVVEAAPSSYGGFAVRVKTETVEHGGLVLSQPVTVQMFTDREFVVGEPVRAVGELSVRGTYYRVKGGLYPQEGTTGEQQPVQSAKTRVRETVQARVGQDSAGLILGMAYGDDSSLSTSALENMRTAGLTHLTAVSGSNITLIFVVGFRAAHRLRLRRYWRIGCGLICAGLYVGLVGLDGSVLRAWAMGVLGGIGMVAGHGAHRAAMLSTCLLFLLMVAPELATDFGFVLSAVATASLLFLAPALRRLATRVMPGICADLITIPLSAALWCTPIILLLSEAIYPFTVLANLLVAPLVAPITMVGLAVLFLVGTGANALFSERLLLPLGDALAQAVHTVAGWVASLPGSSLPVTVSFGPLAGSTAVVAGLTLAVLVADHRYNRPPAVRRTQNSLSLTREQT